MHLDFQSKKRTEVESLSAFIAKKQDVKTPLMKQMYESLQLKA
jgi:ketopantoate reductase